MRTTDKKAIAQLAFKFVLLIGIVNLFADFTYEGGRSIMGPFLATLGANGTIVGFVAGFGELMGYGLRSVSGYLGDRTQKYWLITFVGYAINMLAVPALALAGNWPMAAALIILERTGRAVRRPNVEAMLSHTTKDMGAGWVFGFNEALDQAGATLGPLVVALVLYLKGGFREGFAVLLIPALLCVAALVVARINFPRPQDFERGEPAPAEEKGFSRVYWLYMLAGALIAAGFADFALISFHFQEAASYTTDTIPLLYAMAMAVAAISAFVFGRLQDKIGPAATFVAFFLSAFFAPFVFLGAAVPAAIGIVLWGIGLGAQDSLLKALLTNIISKQRRSTAFGLFDTGFGVAWFAGSAVMGLLYDRSIPALVAFSVVTQLAALPVFMLAQSRRGNHPQG